MTLLIAIMVGVVFAVSTYLMLGRELKSVCMGVFLLGHGANLAIIAASRSPVGKIAPVLPETAGHAAADQINFYLAPLVDPLPQALILTAIVIGFAVQAFLLTMLVITWRRTRTLELAELAHEVHDA
jgi:multicomponent Na+:H+ antiporter subunit C